MARGALRLRGRRSFGLGKNGSDVNGVVVLVKIIDIVFHGGAYDTECEFVPRDIIVAK